jgi:hypothetical protein
VTDKLPSKAIKPAINTSPLIFLTKGGFLDLLQIVSPEIIVPQAVSTEIQAYGETDITAFTLAKTSWLVGHSHPGNFRYSSYS